MQRVKKTFIIIKLSQTERFLNLFMVIFKGSFAIKSNTGEMNCKECFQLTGIKILFEPSDIQKC